MTNREEHAIGFAIAQAPIKDPVKIGIAIDIANYLMMPTNRRNQFLSTVKYEIKKSERKEKPPHAQPENPE